MTKSKKKTRKTKTRKTTKNTARSDRARNAAHGNAPESVGATWTDVLLGALPILASYLALSDDDDDSEQADRTPLCSLCGRLLELPGADHDRAPIDRITPFPAYRDLGALFTKAAA